jgi:hypothetical protein
MTEQLSSNSNEPVPINQSISGNTGQAQQIHATSGSVVAYQHNTVNYYYPESSKGAYSSSFYIKNTNHYNKVLQELNLASKPLLNWPKTVNGNQEINRPELNYLLSQIKDNTSARQSQILTDYVLEYQDGLFVRPSFLRSLHYLRATNSKSYRKQLKVLLKQAEPNCSFLKNWISRWVLNTLRSDFS